MNIITCEKLEKVFTQRELFSEADFYLQEGDKAGIVGINGTGKSTLLKMIAGLEEPDGGQIILANHLVLGYLPQHPQFDAQQSVLDSVVRMSAEQQDASGTDRITQAKSMLTKLGITDFEQKAGELSGGQQKRLALVAVLMQQCDVLLLDEPTNHLDQEMAQWLEDTLKNFRGAILMVTHDRYFLDSVCNRIVEIDQGKIYTYEAGYSGYLELKAQRQEMSMASDRKRKSLLRVELEWVKRGARARTTKQKFRLNRYETLSQIEDTQVDGQVEMGSVATRMGRTTIELDGICKHYGTRDLIRDFTYIFLRNDRIGIIGPNGCGKTTLMKIIAGRLQPDSGLVTIGQTIRIGYYSQMIEDAQAAMDPHQKLIDYIRDTAEYVETSEGKISASQMLEKFLFLKSAQYSTLEKLSGGEKRRLNLLRVLMEAPNVLLLDEPTNDLDIMTLCILEEYLDHFQGIIIIVSHDRYFLDRTVERIFAFQPDGTLKQYEGNYTDYALKKQEEQGTGAAGSAGNGSGNPSNGACTPGTDDAQAEKADWKKQSASLRKLRFTWQEQKDYETIETDIASLEEKLDQLTEQMAASASDFVRLNELTGQQEETRRQLDEKMERWVYLEDLAEKIKAQE